MLYIFDLGNVIVDIDFNRVLGVWSDFSRIPLANLQKNFVIEDAFYRHERGQITDEDFASELCQQMGMALSFEQFTKGWQAVFVDIRSEVINIMRSLREEGHRVVVLSNTNHLHTQFWFNEYPQIALAADKIYLSQDMGMRKPDAVIYEKLLEQEAISADLAIFFDDNADNITGAERAGIKSILVRDRRTIPDYFADKRQNEGASNSDG